MLNRSFAPFHCIAKSRWQIGFGLRSRKKVKVILDHDVLNKIQNKFGILSEGTLFVCGDDIDDDDLGIN